MKIIHVVPNVGNEASGPTYSTVRLSQTIAEMGDEVLLLSVKDGAVASANNFQHRVYPKAKCPSGVWLSPKLYEALMEESKTADILHSHSLWAMPNVYPGRAAKQSSIPLVLSPRGTLSEWALSHSAIRKKLFWWMLQKRVVKGAACLHATSEDEYLDIRRIGLKQPVCIIPNGIDIPNLIPKEKIFSDSRSDLRTLLYLGRLHPKKGIDLLIRAWSEIGTVRKDWQLRIVGPGDERYINELNDLVSRLKVPRVEFVGAVFGSEKQLEYQRADLFILPTHSENFGMTIAESLAVGTPVITTYGAPWSGLEQHGAGWWVEIGIDPLIACLDHAMTKSSEQLSSMGELGREWMRHDFSWHEISHKMKRTYAWLLSGGDRPAWVKD